MAKRRGDQVCWGGHQLGLLTALASGASAHQVAWILQALQHKQPLQTLGWPVGQANILELVNLCHNLHTFPHTKVMLFGSRRQGRATADRAVSETGLSALSAPTLEPTCCYSNITAAAANSSR